MRRFNGWKRIFLILSFFWFLFVLLFFNIDHITNFLHYLSDSPRWVAIIASFLLPPIAVWALVYLVILIKKWVMRGFIQEKEHPTTDLSNIINASGTVVVALATIFLVIVSYFNIDESRKVREATENLANSTAGQLDEAKKMRVSTEKLANSTVSQSDEAKKMRIQTTRQTDTIIDQFKIRSYPALLITNEPLIITEPTVNNLKYITHKYSIINRGEITAYKVSSLAVYCYKKGNYQLFDVAKSNYYEGKEGLQVLDFEDIIPSNSQINITTNYQSWALNQFWELKSFLLIIKYSVPYDKKQRYEYHAYSLESDPGQKEKFVWQEMSKNDSKELCKSFINEKKDPTIKVKIEKFLSDFKMQ